MRQISLVGAVDEEVGDYFPEFLDMLEESPFLKVTFLFWIRESQQDGNLCTLLLTLLTLLTLHSNLTAHAGTSPQSKEEYDSKRKSHRHLMVSHNSVFQRLHHERTLYF